MDLFEGGHALLPLESYFAGGLPYRDVIPAHGLGADGGSTLIASRLVGNSVAALVRFEAVLLNLLFWPTIYLLGLAATRSVGWALFTTLILFFYLPQAGFLRAVPALLALVCSLYASRRTTRWAWRVAGVMVALATIYALEFGLYSAVAASVGLAISNGSKSRNVIAWLSGFLIVVVPVLFIAGQAGLLGSIVDVHMTYLPKLFPIYAFGLGTVVEKALSGESQAVIFVIGLLAAAAIVGLGVASWPRIAPRQAVLLTLAAFFIAASLSVIDRHHFEYALFVVPAAATVMLPGAADTSPKGRILSWSILFGAVVLTAEPVNVVRGSIARLGQQSIPVGWVRLEEPNRAKATYVREEDARVVDATRAFLEGNPLGTEETWLDLANAPGLYYLFERRPPVRFQGVPFMQPPAAEIEVENVLRRDKRIRAVLVATGQRAADTIDGIENRRRVPRLWDAVEECFEPGFERSGVVFWLRRTGNCQSNP
ncbi:MAG TPA: hypothetical protein VIA29_04420 [Thermoanaerobaculia bacterium]